MRPKNREKYTLDLSRSKRIDNYTLVVPHQRNPRNAKSGNSWRDEARGWGRAFASVADELLGTIPEALDEIGSSKRRRR
jgi:hypothetical protein